MPEGWRVGTAGPCKPGSDRAQDRRRVAEVYVVGLKDLPADIDPEECVRGPELPDHRIVEVLIDEISIRGKGVCKPVDVLETGLFGQLINPGAIHLVDAAMPFPHVHQLSDVEVAIGCRGRARTSRLHAEAPGRKNPAPKGGARR